MKKQEFYKDKYKKIHGVIFNLNKVAGNPNYSSNLNNNFSDEDMAKMRKLSNQLSQQIHELNAGRNIFLDNKKEGKNE
jgi:hypothetical protein